MEVLKFQNIFRIIPYILIASTVFAHVTLEDQILDLTKRIEKNALDATLFLRRGDLYRMLNEDEKALADYEQTKRLDPTLSEVDLSMAQLFLKQAKTEDALKVLNTFLTQDPDHIKARLIRARAWMNAGKYLGAAQDFTHVIEQYEPPRKPSPEFFIERAKALSAMGQSYIPQAISGLDEGMNRLGELVTLVSYAIELECLRQNYDAALIRLERIQAHSQQPLLWMAQKGDILEQAGRWQDAYTAYTDALKAIESLPIHRQKTQAILSLSERLKTKRANIEQKLAPGLQMQKNDHE